VDIDPQAVEVTKLSLLLKVLEGENQDTLERQMKLFKERALPDLGSNIKCGNSLIGPDFYQGKQMNLLENEEIYRINPFDWQKEFPDIMKQGGFDAVIGNPPYIFTRGQLSENERHYFSSKYRLSWEKQNTYMLFMELMIRLLDRNGRGGFIVPNSWLTIESAKLLRKALIPRLEIVTDLNYMVFNRVSMEPCIFVASGRDQHNAVCVLRANSKDKFVESKILQINRERWIDLNYRISFSESVNISVIIDKIVSMSRTIGEIFNARTGLQAYEEGKGTPPQSAADVKNHIFDRNNWKDENSVRYLQGRDVGRYRLNWSGMWMQYGTWLSQPREFDIFSRPRVLLREITSSFPLCLNATYVRGDFLNNKSILNVLHPCDDEEELKRLVGILNSRVISLFYKQRAVKSARKIFPKVVVKNLREFPYPKNIEKVKGNKLVETVDQMFALHKQLAVAKTPDEKTRIQRQVDATDHQIDRLVYELYDFTDKEIQIVEQGI
jgi:hypothetical protein